MFLGWVRIVSGRCSEVCVAMLGFGRFHHPFGNVKNAVFLRVSVQRMHARDFLNTIENMAILTFLKGGEITQKPKSQRAFWNSVQKQCEPSPRTLQHPFLSIVQQREPRVAMFDTIGGGSLFLVMT